MTIFQDAGDYEALETILERTAKRVGMRMVSYCLMSNHWHLVVWPRRDGDLSKFMGC